MIQVCKFFPWMRRLFLWRSCNIKLNESTASVGMPPNIARKRKDSLLLVKGNVRINFIFHFRASEKVKRWSTQVRFLAFGLLELTLSEHTLSKVARLKYGVFVPPRLSSLYGFLYGMLSSFVRRFSTLLLMGLHLGANKALILSNQN